MNSFAKLLSLIWSSKQRALAFWLVWLLLFPIVFVRFVVSDIVHLRFRHPTAWLKTSLVRMSVHDQMVKGKG